MSPRRRREEGGVVLVVVVVGRAAAAVAPTVAAEEEAPSRLRRVRGRQWVCEEQENTRDEAAHDHVDINRNVEFFGWNGP